MNQKPTKSPARPFGLAYLEPFDGQGSLRISSGVRVGEVIRPVGPTSAPTLGKLDSD
jgi:hypothetical protein